MKVIRIINYKFIFAKLNGSDDKIPENYRFIGYDIAYPPESDEDFSAFNDNGLFSVWKNAYNYMVYYLSQGWSERGIFGIYEIYEKIPQST